MKKIQAILCAFFLATIIILSCNNKSNTDQPDNKKESPEQINSADVYFGAYVDSAKAREYIDRYKKNYKPNKLTPKDSITKAVWFDRDMFIYIDSMITKVDPSISGVRIYFGAYDRGGRVLGQATDNQVSLFFVATRESADHHKEDWQFFKKPTKDVLNHGELCPNNCE